MNKKILIWLLAFCFLLCLGNLNHMRHEEINYYYVPNWPHIILEKYPADQSYIVVHIAQISYNLNDHKSLIGVDSDTRKKIYYKTISLYDVYFNKLREKKNIQLTEVSSNSLYDIVKNDNIKIPDFEEINSYCLCSFNVMGIAEDDGLPDLTNGGTYYCDENNVKNFAAELASKIPNIKLIQTAKVDNIVFWKVDDGKKENDNKFQASSR